MPRGGLPGNRGGGGLPGNRGGSGKEGNTGNRGGSGKEGNTGNKGGSGKEGNTGNKGASGSRGNKGGAAAGNTNASSAETKARKLFEEGEELHRHGNSNAALQKYEAAVKVYPDLFDAQNNIGVILAERYAAGERLPGQFSKICEHFEKAAVRCSASLINLCVFRFNGENGSKSDPDENVNDCRYIKEHMNPVTGAEHHVFGRSLLRLACCTEDHDEALLEIAVDHFRLAVAADPSSSIFQTTLGSVLASRGKSLEAREIFDAVLKIRPRYQFALDMVQKLSSEVLCRLPTCPIVDCISCFFFFINFHRAYFRRQHLPLGEMTLLVQRKIRQFIFDYMCESLL
jgi:tetratricopeptide (TPR) repeat protein